MNFISNFLNGGTEVEDKNLDIASVDKDANKEKVSRSPDFLGASRGSSIIR